MKKTTLLTLIVIGIVLSGCTMQNIITNNNVNPTPNNQNTDEDITNTNENTNINLTSNPNYCQTSDDCIAISNPSNGCYFGYFNKNASEAIDEFKDNPKMMQQDCPRFSEVYCKNNKCMADKK